MARLGLLRTRSGPSQPEGPVSAPAVCDASPKPGQAEPGRTEPGQVEPGQAEPGPQRLPFYPRLLRLHHVRPSAWQRALLGEGMVLTGGVLALADLASAWTVLVLPVAVAGVVKGHDVLAGALPPTATPAAASSVEGAPAVDVPPVEAHVPRRRRAAP